MCLNDEENSQIGGSNVVADTGDDGNAGSTAQPACGLQGTPPSAIVYAVPEFIWGMSANRREKKISAEPFVRRDCSYLRPRPNKNSTKATIRTTPSMPIPPPIP